MESRTNNKNTHNASSASEATGESIHNDSDEFQVSGNNLVIEKSVFFPGGRYCRSSNFEREQFGSEYLEMYGLENCDGRYAVFSSGVNAISALIYNIVCQKPEKTVVCGDELYCDSPRILKYLRCNTKPFDVRNSEEILKYFKENGQNISLFYVESCSNPSGQMFDFTLVDKLKELAPDCFFCVDNTWCTSYGFNPLDYNMDIVLESTPNI